MKKIALLLVATLLFATLVACARPNQFSNTASNSASNTTESAVVNENIGTKTIKDTASLTGKHKVEIEVKNYGIIRLELDADSAPISTENFLDLAKSGFYNGLTFHRIISGFMIQGGDPLGNGTGGSSQEIKGEFAANGVNNSLKHTRGAISMARSMQNDSASSQFFIVHKDSAHLDGQYAAFGYVTEGMEVVDKICESTPVVDNNGTVEKPNQPIITAVRVL